MSHGGMTMENGGKEYMKLLFSIKSNKVLEEVFKEMEAQVNKWGEQNHASYTYPDVTLGQRVTNADEAKIICDSKMDVGNGSWTDIFLEEALEAVDEAREGNKEMLRMELIQVAAVAVSWVMSIDRNGR
ncbi:hypothetical protein [Pseudomonas helleri]|uniref:hypothetical protein n=1 Tax=Pseudomonas helleri TaxID=1608996 RepID=UPI00242F2F2E|nr:hypothetical protein [Pseudomonas helleri]